VCSCCTDGDVNRALQHQLRAVPGVKRISVLHLITDLDPGGAERQLLILLRALDSSSVRSEVVYMKGRGGLVPLLSEVGVPVRRLKPGPFALADLVLILVAGRFDVLHTHLIHADGLGALAAMLARIPTLISSRHNDNPRFATPWIAAMHRASSLRASRVLAISEAVRRYLVVNRTVAWPDRIRVVHYGVDPAPYEAALVTRADTRSSLGLDTGDLVVASFGRLIELKAHRVLIAAMSQLKSRWPQARLLIVGDGPLRSELDRLTQDLGLTDAVRMLGYRADIPELMVASDIVAMPSDSEGFGLVLVEAMAAARPVVATNVSAIPEIVVPGMTGLLVPPRDAVRLAAALDSLLTSAALREEFGMNGRERMRAIFSDRQMASKIEGIYREALMQALSRYV
jgi:glycosyltransferase involved in cell wall biosynthesis